MKQKLRRYISQQNTKQAIQELLQITQERDELHEEVILQSAQYEQYKKEKRAGISSVEQQEQAIAKINQALLEIINKLEEIHDNTSTKMQIATIKNDDKSIQKKIGQWAVGFGAVIAILAGIAEFTGYSLRDLFRTEKKDSFSLTVLVHGKAGKDDRILVNQGKVILDIGEARREASINEKGEATFKELPRSYDKEKVFISINHPQPYYPVKRDVEYVLTKGKPIYLSVELKGIDVVQGRVLDFYTEKPLDSVRVSFQNIPTFSDEFGWFELNIPVERQNKFIRLNFYKTGYNMETLDSIAPHTKQEIGIALKPSDSIKE